MSQLQDAIDSIDTNQEKLFKLLGKLVQFKTLAPPGRNTNDAQAFIADYLKQMGFQVDQWELFKNDSLVVGQRQAGSDDYQSLILNGHVDVAELNPDEQWATDPFQLVQKGARLFGRGVADMKGALAAMLFATKTLQDYGLELPGKLLIESVIGEESGEAGTLDTVKHGYRGDFAIVGDISDFHIQGQGGVITGWITVKSDQTYHDATRRQFLNAGGKLNGASAIEKMMKVIQGLNDLERHWAVQKSYPGVEPGSDTINPAVIEGGRNAAFVADECRLWVTVHFYPDEDYREVIKEVEDHINAVARADFWLRDHMPTYKWGGKSMVEDRGEIFPALDLDADSDAVQLLKKSHQQVLRTAPIVDVSPSVTDGGWFGYSQIPAAIYGPGQIEEAHSVNESIAAQELINYTKVLMAFMYHWLNQQKESL